MRRLGSRPDARARLASTPLRHRSPRGCSSRLRAPARGAAQVPAGGPRIAARGPGRRAEACAGPGTVRKLTARRRGRASPEGVPGTGGPRGGPHRPDRRGRSELDRADKKPPGNRPPSRGPAPEVPLIRAPLRGRVSRRGFLSVLGAGRGASSRAAAWRWLGAMVRFMFPNVLYEPPQEFKAGFPSRVRRRRGGRALQGLATACGSCASRPVSTRSRRPARTSGCTPNWLAAEEKFKCPCHGSGFIKSGHQRRGARPATARALQDHAGRGRPDPDRQEHEVPGGEGAVDHGRRLPPLRRPEFRAPVPRARPTPNRSSALGRMSCSRRRSRSHPRSMPSARRRSPHEP